MFGMWKWSFPAPRMMCANDEVGAGLTGSNLGHTIESASGCAILRQQGQFGRASQAKIDSSSQPRPSYADGVNATRLIVG